MPMKTRFTCIPFFLLLSFAVPVQIWADDPLLGPGDCDEDCADKCKDKKKKDNGDNTDPGDNGGGDGSTGCGDSTGGGKDNNSKPTNTYTITTSPSSQVDSYTLFGITFTFTDGTAHTIYDSDGNVSEQGWSDHYSSSGGGSLTISFSSISGYSISGWDSSVGSFSASDMGTLNTSTSSVSGV